ncbi:MAG: D-proline reductase (dithiol) proprotein PrdA [Turicibacter sp.]|nr:D-proline reductase (dithiol) proprotein PrdA [Turicibacter sp.]
MAITEETVKEHAKDPAVLCCRAEEGIVITPANLEDPALFADLEDSGLLTLPDDCLTIEQVIGAKLTKTLDSLTPLTPDVVDGIVATEEKVAEVAPIEAASAVEVAPVAAPVTSDVSVNHGVLKLSIAEGKGINLEIPLSAIGSASIAPAPVAVNSEVAPKAVTSTATEETTTSEARLMRSIVQKHFEITEVIFGDETKIEGTTLTLRQAESLCEEAVALEELVEKMSVEIITPDKYDTFSETIMDVSPIATKEEGLLGEGVTRVLDGVVVLLTGTDANGVQIGEFGSSEGELEKNIMWGRPGAPDRGEILIKIEVVIKELANMERPGPLAAHKAADYITDEVRKALKEFEGTAVDSKEISQYRRTGNKRVVLIKEIMGQGAMHDNLILPTEPAGTLGAKANVDLGNLPVMLSPLEVLDGAIHALTCIGPASKENTRHYFREPLVLRAMDDEEIDVVGVIFVGSPQANTEKDYVSKRLGMMIEAMDVDGAILTTEGFGNNHIDFASHIEEIGKRGVAIVGMTYSAVQGALVVGNKYMDALIDHNKSMQGIENEILSNNTLCEEDAIRALAMLKAKMAGVEIKAAERKWNPNVKANNIEAIEKATGTKIALTDNEQVLEKSKKRAELYEKE